MLAFESDGRANGVKMVDEVEAELGDARLDDLIGAANHEKLAEDIELLDGAAAEFCLLYTSPLASGTPSRWQHSAGMNWCTVRRWATGAPPQRVLGYGINLARLGRVHTLPCRGLSLIHI